ncbi:DUF1311 domain-containing protein [Thalassotalea mangrovi]|uniref:DUF1311 domain-containing protein n=2 Tax=Thalassotalea mangrovi TaxID=2572245 RepID=A0A4U1B2N4_9GAMM|nr:DUF1311 domain-containing protein [Thalassotalea mangrovi]
MLCLLTACHDNTQLPDSEPDENNIQTCSMERYQAIAKRVQTGDGQGHGPDIGSTEWQSVVEFKLKVRGQNDVPEKNSRAWCDFIEKQLQADTDLDDANKMNKTAATTPSFSCEKVIEGSTEALICDQSNLANLDRQLDDVYQAALSKSSGGMRATLQAEQRGWLKGRNECWKQELQSQCIAVSYQWRIAELQARYQLVENTGPQFYQCEQNPANELVVTFYQTNPKTLIAERGDSVSLMYIQESASGSRYQGRNESFWEHQGEAMVTWGYQQPQMRCVRTQAD